MKIDMTSVAILAFSTNFCHRKIDLSSNAVEPQVSVIEKLVKLTIFGIFNAKCMLASLAMTKNETFSAIFKLDVFCHLLGT